MRYRMWILLVLLICAAGVWASSETNEIELDIRLNESVVLGEPVILEYGISNNTSQTLEVWLGKNHIEWAGLNVIDPQGNPAPSVPDYRPEQKGGLRPLDRVRISPNSHYRGYIVLTRLYEISKTGNYLVQINARLSYGPDLEPATATATDDMDYVVSVKQGEAKTLAEIAEKHYQSIGATTNASLRWTSIEALFTMPESEGVLAIWRNAGKVGLDDRRKAIEQLVRVGSLNTADILTSMWDDSSQPQDIRNEAKIALNNLWWTGRDEVKKYVEKLFAERGEAITKGGPVVPCD